MTSYSFLKNLGFLYSGDQRKCSNSSWAWQVLKRNINALRGISDCLTHHSTLTHDQTMPFLAVIVSTGEPILGIEYRHPMWGQTASP